MASTLKKKKKTFPASRASKQGIVKYWASGWQTAADTYAKNILKNGYYWQSSRIWMREEPKTPDMIQTILPVVLVWDDSLWWGVSPTVTLLHCTSHINNQHPSQHVKETWCSCFFPIPSPLLSPVSSPTKPIHHSRRCVCTQYSHGDSLQHNAVSGFVSAWLRYWYTLLWKCCSCFNPNSPASFHLTTS